MKLNLEQLSAISGGIDKEKVAIFEIKYTEGQWCIFLNGEVIPGQCFEDEGYATIVAQFLAYGTRRLAEGSSIGDTMGSISDIIFGAPKSHKRRRRK